MANSHRFGLAWRPAARARHGGFMPGLHCRRRDWLDIGLHEGVDEERSRHGEGELDAVHTRSQEVPNNSGPDRSVFIYKSLPPTRGGPSRQIMLTIVKATKDLINNETIRALKKASLLLG